jgi:hypothetical protein
MGKLFKLSTGGSAPHPDLRSVSAKIRHRFYIDYKKCEICKSSSTRYTKSDKCIMCQRFKIELTRHYSRIDDHSISPWPEGVPAVFNHPKLLGEVKAMRELIRSKEGYTLHYEPCTTYGHVRVSSSDGTPCMQCKTALKPRDQAISDGESHYVSTSPCGSCGEITLRSVGDKTCEACEYTPGTTEDNRQTPDSIMMSANPDMILTREDANAYDMKVYRTGQQCVHGHNGWRYVSTGNCITCLRTKDGE